MIIGISGKAQSGKDTICSMIIYCIWYYQVYNRFKEVDKSYSEKFSIEHFQKFKGHEFELMSTFYKHAFADYLKEMLAVLLDAERSEFEDINFKNSKVDWLNNITVRELLQMAGTAMRGISPDFWINVLLKDYSGEDNDNWIIPDVRYKSEVEGIRRADKYSLLIRVNKPGIVLMNHSSETELDDYKDWDIVIENTGTLEDLLLKVREFLDSKGLLY